MTTSITRLTTTTAASRNINWSQLHIKGSATTSRVTTMTLTTKIKTTRTTSRTAITTTAIAA